MPAKGGFILTSDDIEYLRNVHLLRIATIDHLTALTNRSYTRTQKRTARLQTRGYLDALTSPPRKILYALGREGIAALVEAGHASEELLEKRLRSKDLKELFLRHLLMVKDIQVKLLTFTRGTPIRIVRWSEGEELYDSVTILETNGARPVKTRIPVRPDAFFLLQDTTRPAGKNTLPFVLEADRSTESHQRMRSKINGYVHYFQQDLAFTKWGYKAFKVVTVTQTTARAHNLKNDLHDLIPPQLRPGYIFTGIEELTLDMLIPETAAPTSTTATP